MRISTGRSYKNIFNFSCYIKRTAAVLLALAIVCSGAQIRTFAAEKGTTDAEKYNSNTYNYKVKDYSTVIKGSKSSVAVDCYYSVFSLSGSGKAVKRINKFFKNLSKEFDPETILGYAESMAEDANVDPNMTLYDTNRAWVVYNDGKYISVTMERYWYAGGVSNTFHDGYTFSLKTGKRAPISKVTGLTFDQIKEKVTADISEKFVVDDMTKALLDTIKESDINYYLTNDRHCVITFKPYDVGQGGWVYEYSFEY